MTTTLTPPASGTSPAKVHRFPNGAHFGLDFRAIGDQNPGHWTIQLNTGVSFGSCELFDQMEDFLQEGGRRPGQSRLCDWRFRIDPICHPKADGKRGYHEDTRYTEAEFQDGILTIRTRGMGQRLQALFESIILPEMLIGVTQTEISINLNPLKGSMKYHG